MKTVIFLTLVFIVISNSGCNKSENPTENQQNTSIQITTNVSTSLTRIFQDGVSIKSLIGSGTISEIVQGSYTLIIEAQGYKSQSENITIINGQLLQKNVQLIRSSQPMVYISGGTFWMGCTSEQSACNDSEKPIHQVTLSAYEIGIYEIDQSLWNFIMGTNPSMNTGDNKPVEKVNWYDAINFCNNLSLREELTPVYTINGTNVTANWAANGYRLPTEAEWEYAARGGENSTGTIFSGSNSVRLVAWTQGDNPGGLHDVGKKSPNQLGIYDMSGNVWEWCWDWHSSSYYTSSIQANPTGPESGSSRVLRGGSFNEGASSQRVASRGSGSPANKNFDRGFRIARTK